MIKLALMFLFFGARIWIDKTLGLGFFTKVVKDIKQAKTVHLVRKLSHYFVIARFTYGDDQTYFTCSRHDTPDQVRSKLGAVKQAYNRLRDQNARDIDVHVIHGEERPTIIGGTNG